MIAFAAFIFIVITAPIWMALAGVAIAWIVIIMAWIIIPTTIAIMVHPDTLDGSKPLYSLFAFCISLYVEILIYKELGKDELYKPINKIKDDKYADLFDKDGQIITKDKSSSILFDLTD